MHVGGQVLSLHQGQSNMAYTPRSMAGMNNMSAEIARADSPQYKDIRLFTVGQVVADSTRTGVHCVEKVYK